MAIRSFKDNDAEIFFRNGIHPKNKGWNSVISIARRKLDILHYAREFKDLRSPPGNRLEPLKGDLTGYYSIRINDQWQVVFKWDDEPYDVCIMDYH